MTRSNIAEAKGIISPFHYFISINATDDEKDAGVSRLYIDKFRTGKGGSMVHIYQNLSAARFYDAQKTCNVFWDLKNGCKRPIPLD